MSSSPDQICPNCGNELSPTEVTKCSRCGHRLKRTVPLANDTVPVSMVQTGTSSPPQFSPPSRTQKRLTKSPLVRSLLVSLGVLVIPSGVAFDLLVHKGPATNNALALHQPTHVPTPTAIPMVRIVIKLIDVVCNNSEAVIGHDKFYMMTTFAKTLKPSVDQSHLTLPLDIDDGQDLPFPQSPSIVFDGMIPQGGAIAGGFTAYNDMNNAAWANIGSWAAFITGKVGDALIQGGVDTVDPTLVVAGVILDVAVKAWYDIAVPKLNSSNAHQLGYVPLVVSATVAPTEVVKLHFHNDGGAFGWGGWDYVVQYQITRTLG